jgi:hypothetical protein
MTEKEKEFSRAKRNVFREVVVYLTLIYEKTLEDLWMEAFVDVQHCYNLLGTRNVQNIASAETRNELDLTLVRGSHYFSEIKRRRTDLFHDSGKKGTEKNPIINTCGNEDEEMSKISKPLKHAVKGEFGSHDAQLILQHSKTIATDQVMKAKNMTCSEEYRKDREDDEFSRNKNDKEITSGSVLAVTDIEVRDEKVELSLTEVDKCPDVISDHQKDRSLHEDWSMGSTSEHVFEKIPVHLQGGEVPKSNKIGTDINGKLTDKNVYEHVHGAKNGSKKQNTISAANSRGNTCDLDQKEEVLFCEESDKRNEADTIQYDNSTIKDMDEENAIGRESETERQTQRMAAMEYVVNATLAHMAYFSETYKEAYILAKYIEHM